MITDAELVRQARRGDDNALEMLLRRYQDPLYGYLLRMLKNRQDAEETVQAAFLIAIRSLSRYREQGRFKAWLFRIAHREALRVLRRTKRRREIFEQGADSTVDEGIDPQPQPDEAAEAGEKRQRLETALGTLPAVEREVVLLRMKEDLTFKEIAKLTGCPLGTALGRMRNALRRLREMMEDDE